MDRVLFGATRFVAANIGPEYVDPPSFDLKAVYDTSNSKTPLIFVLSPGVDPTAGMKDFLPINYTFFFIVHLYIIYESTIAIVVLSLIYQAHIYLFARSPYLHSHIVLSLDMFHPYLSFRYLSNGCSLGCQS